MTATATREQRFLAKINQKLPTEVDWKAGAIRYCKAVIRDQGPSGELYLLNKPFCGGPDFSPFVDDLSKFVAMVQALHLPARANILDVGSGPGWVSEYFGRLGHSVLGIDICDDLLAIARRRLDKTPFETFPGEKLSVDFLVHDIESGPVPSPRRFDLGYFESTLHHFFDPIAVLRNVAATLKEDGVIAIVEGAAPPVDSEGYQKLVRVMTEYETIERPYSREELIELFAITGFKHYRFGVPVCGVYQQREANTLQHLVAEGGGWNIAIASKTPAGLTRLGGMETEAATPFAFGGGFYTEERDATGRYFRWSQGQGYMQARAGKRVRFAIGTYPASLASRQQKVLVYLNGQLRQSCILTEARPVYEFVLDGLTDHGASEIRFESDCLFHPAWFSLADSRPLSFWVRAEAGD